MKTLCFICFALFSYVSFGQAFISPIEDNDIGQMKSAVVLQNDGVEVEGVKFSMYALSNGKLSSFTLKKEDGEKIKYKAEAIQLVKIEPNGLAKTMMKVSSPNLVAAIKKDYSAIDKMKYVTFEQVEIKKGKYKLLQLLNPGLDERIKVYLDPNAKETASFLGIVGGEDKSYFVKKGDEAFLLKKGKYKKEIMNLFGDSEGLMNMMRNGETDPMFKEFPAHIALYNESFL